jgi:hypothetical protein
LKFPSNEALLLATLLEGDGLERLNDSGNILLRILLCSDSSVSGMQACSLGIDLILVTILGSKPGPKDVRLDRDCLIGGLELLVLCSFGIGKFGNPILKSSDEHKYQKSLNHAKLNNSLDNVNLNGYRNS